MRGAGDGGKGGLWSPIGFQACSCQLVVVWPVGCGTHSGLGVCICEMGLLLLLRTGVTCRLPEVSGKDREQIVRVGPGAGSLGTAEGPHAAVLLLHKPFAPWLLSL